MYKLVIDIDKVINCQSKGEKTKAINESAGSGVEKSATIILNSAFCDNKNNLNKTSNFVMKINNTKEDKKLYEAEEINEKYKKVNIENKAADKEDEEIKEKFEKVDIEEEIEDYEEEEMGKEEDKGENSEETEEEITEFVEVYIVDEEVDKKAVKVNIQDKEETIKASAEIKDDKRKPFVCDCCDLIFHSQESLSSHKKTHVNNDKSNKLLEFKCHLCKKAFLDEDDVKIHKKEAHPKIKKWRNYKKNIAANNNNYNCEICKVDFHDKSLYDEHSLEHEEKLAAVEEIVEVKNNKLIDLTNSSPGQDILKCRICKMVFKSSGKLDEHFNYCAGERKDKWECIICHNLYETHELLYAHFEDHDDTTHH